MNNEYFEPAELVLNGYWYTIHYTSNHIGYDEYPLIYCIEPSIKFENNFVGLNIHHLPLSERIEFIKQFNKFTNFLNDDTRHVLTKEKLVNNIFLGCQNAIRMYNRKNILDIYRIKNKAIPYFIEYNGIIMNKNPGSVLNKYLSEIGFNKSNESKIGD